MRIAVSAAEDRGLDSAVHAHFGRCPYFVLADLEGQAITSVKVVANPFYGNHQPGEVPAFIARQGAKVMITGGMGMRAVEIFQESGIEPVTGASGSARQAIEAYLNGSLQGAGPCGESIEHRGES